MPVQVNKQGGASSFVLARIEFISKLVVFLFAIILFGKQFFGKPNEFFFFFYQLLEKHDQVRITVGEKVFTVTRIEKDSCGSEKWFNQAFATIECCDHFAA